MNPDPQPQVRSQEPAQYQVENRVQLDTTSGLFSPRTIDWRIWLGIAVTAIWLLVLGMYISGAVGWFNIGNVPIDTLGSFLEGSFAPLAFLWFVLAYFSQQKELAQNTEALKMQSLEMQRSVEQASIQSTAISESEMHARREAFLRTHDIVKQQLGNILGFLYISSQGTNAAGNVPSEKLSELWHKNAQQDPEVFSRQLMELSFLHSERYAYKLFWGTPIRTRHSNKFIFSFERLLNAASECDSNDMIRDAVAGSAHGFIYERMVQFRATPPEGFTFGVFDFDPDAIEPDQPSV
tara:strand:- start:1808 stop:2689 length:882 start_codon:yes stop_codon:yes gene_type:complete